MKNETTDKTILTPVGVSLCPCPWCGAEAHITSLTYPALGAAKTLFGVSCGSLKHRTPVAFATPRSAAAFWADCVERAKKADETTIFVTSRK